VLSQRIEQIHHALDHLDGSFSYFTRGFSHFYNFGGFHGFIVAILWAIAPCENALPKGSAVIKPH
jgi:hypothetical protein